VANFSFKAAPTLGGFSKDYDGISLREIIDLALVSVAIPLGAETKVKAAIKSSFGTDLPSPTISVAGTNGQRFLSSAPDQMLVLFHHEGPDADKIVNTRLKGSAYTTDQTDNWVALQIEGPKAITALERICPIDLHPKSFVQNQYARTQMEHMGAFIIKTGQDSFLLLSASSSARSFLHAVETSILNVS